ncbi:tRNA lysidine(34) synthetase TilS [Thermodesulfobacteriota bacterium]
MKILKTVEETVTAYSMFELEDSVLIGVSGGPDSVALLHILLVLAPRFSIRLGVAHLNHGLRPKVSDKEAEFVASLASEVNLPCYIEKADVRKYQIEKRISLAEAARRVRYKFYDRVAQRNGFNRIALGHHCDDNAELVLMNLMRGSGPVGLSGIPPVREERIVRPLIRLTRPDIIDFLNNKGLKYVSDESNREVRYLRNRIRHRLIPAIKADYNPSIVKTLNRLASILRSEEEWSEKRIAPVFAKLIVNESDDNLFLSVQRLDGIHVAAQRRLIRKGIARIKGNLRSVTLSHIESIIGLLKNGPAYKSLDLPGRIRVRLEGDILRFSKERTPLRDSIVRSGNAAVPPFEYEIVSHGIVFIKEINAHMNFTELAKENVPDFLRTGQDAAYFDMNEITFPLVLRNFRPGDRFTPLGMKGSQKVKKYFINNKVPITERSKCLILLSKGKIIWVVNHRIDESAKVRSSTQNVLRVELFLA